VTHTTPPRYAGMGSRRAPKAVLEAITAAARALAARGYTLRSGGADGCDTAFEAGAGQLRDIYLPWPGFGPTTRTDHPLDAHSIPTPEAHAIAREHHPGWNALSTISQALLARTSHVILGADLNTPVRFAICWTPDGATTATTRTTGGTGQAIRICTALEIPVFNIAVPDHAARLHHLAAEHHPAPQLALETTGRST
jgi:hypothetical protein